MGRFTRSWEHGARRCLSGAACAVQVTCVRISQRARWKAGPGSVRRIGVWGREPGIWAGTLWGSLLISMSDSSYAYECLKTIVLSSKGTLGHLGLMGKADTYCGTRGNYLNYPILIFNIYNMRIIALINL